MPLVNILRGVPDWHQRGGLYEHLGQEVEPDGYRGLHGRSLGCGYVDTREAEATSLFGYSFATLCSRMLR